MQDSWSSSSESRDDRELRDTDKDLSKIKSSRMTACRHSHCDNKSVMYRYDNVPDQGNIYSYQNNPDALGAASFNLSLICFLFLQYSKAQLLSLLVSDLISLISCPHKCDLLID